MGFRLGSSAVTYETGEADAWIMWVRNAMKGCWSMQIGYSSPGKPLHIDTGLQVHASRTVIPVEHLGKSIKELSEIYPAPANDSST